MADAVLADVAERVAKLAAAGRTVGLATVLVGDDPASVGYVAKKHEACERCRHGVDRRAHPGRRVSQVDLLEAIAQLNADPAVDGYLIQHPVPAGFDFNQAMSAVDPAKDADGLHPTNLGLLALGERRRPAALHPARHPGHARSTTRSPWRAGDVVIVGRGPTLGPAAVDAAVPEGAGGQRGGDRRPHRGAGLGRLHPGRGHRGRRRRRAVDHHPGRHPARGRA